MLELVTIADFLFGHEAHDNAVKHLSLENRIVWLHSASSFLLTNFDACLKDKNNTLDAFWLVLTRVEKPEAARV